jgi:murein DD-endopeptidase MepM/ murein hydrolase activator NlpD
MEENGVIHYLEIIFNFNSFSDLLARIDVVNEIMRSEERLYNDLIAARNATIAAREVLYETMLEMEVEVSLREDKREELLVQLDEAGALIYRLMEDVETASILHAEKTAAAEQIQRDINRAVAELERQRAAAAAAAAAARGGGPITGTGSFIWPVPSSHNVTSYFGTRMHPVHRVMRTHWGIDIGADHGVAIVAADSGTVIRSEFNSSYGHFIVIAHGNGYTTLYAHLSSRMVQNGENVTRGQTIGLNGSTGTSTGPHLHFEISRGGERVDPLQYFRRG